MTICECGREARRRRDTCTKCYDRQRKRAAYVPHGGHASPAKPVGPPAVPSGPASSAQTGRATITAEGGEFVNVMVPAEITSDWSHVFAQFKLDPAEFEIVDDTVKMSTWQQSKAADDGKRDVIQLYSYSARFRRRGKDVVRDEIVAEHRAAMRDWAPAERVGESAATPCAAVINLADMQAYKSEGGGIDGLRRRLTDGLENVLDWLERMTAAGRNINELVLVNNGDPFEGCAGNYASQLFTVGGNHRAQTNFVLDVWEMYARELFPRYRLGHFVSVLCNHGELGRLGTAKNQTGDSDNAGGLLAETLRRVLEGRAEFDHLQWTIPHDEMTVYPTISGVPAAFNHGHKIPGSDAGGFEKWLNGQVRGDVGAHEARVWITAHRHHFAAWDMGSCTVFQCPSADGGSKWLRDLTGRYSRSGVLALLVGEHDPMGWSDLAFL